MNIRIFAMAVGLLLMIGVPPASSQPAPDGPKTERQGDTAPAVTAPAAASTPPGYVIGPDDVLQIVFWRDKDLSGEVVVRPDGRISLPLLNDVVAAGRTPEELRAALVASASAYFGNPSATVVVKEIRSRKVFITGSVEKPGPYVLTAPTTVLQLIAMAGGLKDYADQRNIVVMRTTNGQQVSFGVDYRSLLRRQKLEQNLALLPGDTILVR
jgi:polysaccharide export outer membrane protein